MPVFVDAQVKLLTWISPPVPKPVETVYDGKSKLSMLLGEQFLPSIQNQRVVDFGCGLGIEMIELCQAGAARVVGLDMPEVIERARENVTAAGVAAQCEFYSEPDGINGDVVISLDCFEHYEQPETVLEAMYRALRPGGRVHISFGWVWYHPNGSHLIELPPWTHVVFSETAVIQWRAQMRGPGANTYSDIGLNQMTIGRFEKLVSASKFTVEEYLIVPIRPLRWAHTRWTREFTTSTIRCILRKPA